MIISTPELVNAGIISEETAARIDEYYKNKAGQPQSKLLVVFGILGAILAGLGIILIIAHNWDEFSRSTKTVFAFLPLLLAQMLCVISLVKKQDSSVWKESSTAFLFFAVGGSISLVSQIYNIPGDLSSFLLTWMMLCLPLIYVMRSSVTSLLYLAGITYYAVESGYSWSLELTESYYYWMLLLLGLPYYYMLYKKKPESNFMIFHNWFIPLSLIISLGTVASHHGDLMFVAYMSLFGLFYVLGNSTFFKQQKPLNNSYIILGSLGTIVLLLTLSFHWFWDSLIYQQFQYSQFFSSPEFIASLILTLLAAGMLYVQMRNKSLMEIKPFSLVFILFIFIFMIGLSSPVSVVLMNILVFIVGVLTVKEGARRDHFGILNFGLLIIMALAVCRYFDSELSFVVRGIIFLSAGIGFFFANYLMLKKRKRI